MLRLVWGAIRSFSGGRFSLSHLASMFLPSAQVQAKGFRQETLAEAGAASGRSNDRLPARAIATFQFVIADAC